MQYLMVMSRCEANMKFDNRPTIQMPAVQLAKMIEDCRDDILDLSDDDIIIVFEDE